VVEPIFVEEEGARGGFVTFYIERDPDNVAAGAKAAPFGMVDKDDPDIGVVAPFRAPSGG
jgi:hypothetical protein